MKIYRDISEFILYANIATVDDYLLQYTDINPVFYDVHIPYYLERCNQRVWYFYMTRVDKGKHFGKVELFPAPEGTLFRARDYSFTLPGLALQHCVRDLQSWFRRYGLFSRDDIPKGINDQQELEAIILPKVYGPQATTIDKINRLVKHRWERIQTIGAIPGWTASCQIVSIDPKTVKKHYPELHSRWEDMEFEGEFREY